MLEMKIPLPITRIFNHLVARGPRYGDELFIKKKKKIGKIRHNPKIERAISKRAKEKILKSFSCQNHSVDVKHKTTKISI